ncbi:hypothetical protein ACFQH2_06965 [Natronoarchaeum sp. GCM10025703]|uniref:hypothetical protein n=1 Tax=unclassified Natronoarchaeum TaxID=2620183 RepID=UPI00361B1B99
MIATRSGVGLRPLESYQNSRTYRTRYEQETASRTIATTALLAEAQDVDVSLRLEEHGIVPNFDDVALTRPDEQGTDADLTGSSAS